MVFDPFPFVEVNYMIGTPVQSTLVSQVTGTPFWCFDNVYHELLYKFSFSLPSFVKIYYEIDSNNREQLYMSILTSS